MISKHILKITILKETGLIFPTVKWFHLLLVNTNRALANGLENQDSIPGRVIPKTQKIVLDAALLSTRYYKVRIKGKVEQSKEWSSGLPYTSV